MPAEVQLNERIASRIKVREDGSLSNSRVEQYALLRSEGVISTWAAWGIIFPPKDPKKKLGSGYQRQIHSKAVFKERVRMLTEERTELETKGVWGQLEWQARQLYRRGAALNDTALMTRGTELLLRVALKTESPEKPKSDRGPGKPPVDPPQDDPQNDRHDAITSKLLGR